MLGKKKLYYLLHKIEQNIFVSSIKKFIDNDGLEYAGYMAYLNIFSIFPLFITLIALLTMLGETSTGTQIINYITNLIPKYALEIIKPQIIKIIEGPSVGIMSFVFIGALWTTTSTLEGLRKIFNVIYKVKQPPFFIISRMLSIVQFIIAIIILLTTLAGFILLPYIVNYIELILEIKIPSIQNSYINNLYTLAILTFVVSTIYYSLTNKSLRFISIIPGALLSVFLWEICAEGLTYYMANFQEFDVIYGSLAGAIIVLLFFYMINISLIYGAVFNATLLERVNFFKVRN